MGIGYASGSIECCFKIHSINNPRWLPKEQHETKVTSFLALNTLHQTHIYFWAFGVSSAQRLPSSRPSDGLPRETRIHGVKQGMSVRLAWQRSTAPFCRVSGNQHSLWFAQSHCFDVCFNHMNFTCFSCCPVFHCSSCTFYCSYGNLSYSQCLVSNTESCAISFWLQAEHCPPIYRSYEMGIFGVICNRSQKHPSFWAFLWP